MRTAASGNSPRIGDAGRVADATPIRAQVVLRLGQLPVAGYGGGHDGDGVETAGAEHSRYYRSMGSLLLCHYRAVIGHRNPVSSSRKGYAWRKLSFCWSWSRFAEIGVYV